GSGGQKNQTRFLGLKKIGEDFWKPKWGGGQKNQTRFLGSCKVGKHEVFDFGARFLFGGRPSFVDIVDGNGGGLGPVRERTFQAVNITEGESDMYLSSRTRIDIIDKCGRSPRL